MRPQEAQNSAVTELYPLGSEQVVVEGAEALPGVVAAVGPAHEVLQHQPDVYEADVVVGWHVALEDKQLCVGPRRGVCHHPQAWVPLCAVIVYSQMTEGHEGSSHSSENPREDRNAGGCRVEGKNVQPRKGDNHAAV